MSSPSGIMPCNRMGHRSRIRRWGGQIYRAVVSRRGRSDALPGEALMATLPPARRPASGALAADAEYDTGAVQDGWPVCRHHPDPTGPSTPRSPCVRRSSRPYAGTLFRRRESPRPGCRLMAPRTATSSTLGPESATSLRDTHIDSVVSVGDMSRLHSDIRSPLGSSGSRKSWGRAAWAPSTRPDRRLVPCGAQVHPRRRSQHHALSAGPLRPHRPPPRLQGHRSRRGSRARPTSPCNARSTATAKPAPPKTCR